MKPLYTFWCPMHLDWCSHDTTWGVLYNSGLREDGISVWHESEPTNNAELLSKYDEKLLQGMMVKW